MVAHKISGVPLAPGAIVYENARPVALDSSKWQTVKSTKMTISFADEETGNVVSRVTAENADGKVVYIGTRLKVQGKTINEIETSFNDGFGIDAKNVLTYDPVFDTIVPVDKRMTRDALQAIVRRYFDALGSHKPDPSASFKSLCQKRPSKTTQMPTVA